MATKSIFSKYRHLYCFLNPKSAQPILRPKSTSSIDICQAKNPIMNLGLACNRNAENTRLRQNLALSYRLLDDEKLNEGTCNHLTVMAPAQDGAFGEEVMLLVPADISNGGGLHWRKVTASSLIGLDPFAKVVEGEGEPELTAACIHLGVRRVKKDANVLFHSHPPYTTAMSCLVDPTLEQISQNSAIFKDRVAYDNEYNGLASEIEEGERLGKKMGDKDVLIMCNHGVLVAADTVHAAFNEIYSLERACMTQMLAKGAAQRNNLKMLKEDVAVMTKNYSVDNMDKYAWKHFSAYWNKYVEKGSDVFE